MKNQKNRKRRAKVGIRIFTIRTETIKNIFAIFPKAFSGYGLKILLLGTFGFFTGLLEGVGITALIPLFSLFEESSRAAPNIISETIEKVFEIINLPLTVPALLGLIITLFLAKFVAIVIYEYLSVRIFTGYEQKTSDKLFRTSMRAGWPFISKQKLGNLETLIKIDTRQSSRILHAASTSIMICSTLLAYLLVAINISQAVTIIALIFGVFVIFLYKPLFSLSRRLSQEVSKINTRVANHVNESLIGIKTLKAFGIENWAEKKASLFFERMRFLQLRLMVFNKATGEFIQPLGMLFIATTVAFAFYRTSYNLGALAALVYLIHRIFQYTQQIQGVAQDMATNLPYAENIVNYLEAAEKSQEGINPTEGEMFNFEKEFEFNNLSFSYENRDSALDEISFKIQKGEMIGFIGPSGAGKTTVFDLILRLLKPSSGEILIDEKNVDSIKISQWRKNISYVSQDIFILNDTILNNIKFFDKKVSNEDAEEAAKMAGIYDFIVSLPNGFDTLVEERGNSLSAGEKQRIALARALAKKPQILLLDEATSSLDNESEQKIQGAIKSLKGKVTILVIAHRLSTVIDTDKLIVIEKGKITEVGNPRDLLENKETYFYKTYNLRE